MIVSFHRLILNTVWSKQTLVPIIVQMPYTPTNEWQVCEFRAEATLGIRLVVDPTHSNATVKMLETNGVPFVREDDRGMPAFCIDPTAYDTVQNAIEEHKTLRPLIAPMHPDWLRAVDAQASRLYKRTLTPAKLEKLWATVPKRLRDQMQWYHKPGVEFLWAHRDRGMIADEMGLGKTFQSIVFMLSSSSQALCSPENQYEEYPLLIVGPGEVIRKQWKSEWMRWSEWKDDTQIRHLKDGKEGKDFLTRLLETKRGRAKQRKTTGEEEGEEKGPSEVKERVGKKRKASSVAPSSHTACKQQKDTLPKVFLLTYGLLRRPEIAALVSKIGFPSIIFDESHSLKTHDSQQTKICLALSKAPSLRRLVLLSGTPGSKAFEFYPPMKMICPQLFPCFWKPLPNRIRSQKVAREFRITPAMESFAHRYCDPKPEFVPGGGVRWQQKGTVRVAELRAFLKTFILIRRRKEEVIPELDKIRRERIIFLLPSRLLFQTHADMAKLAEYEASGAKKQHETHMMSIFNNSLPQLKRPLVERFVRDLLLDGPLAVRRHASAWVLPHVHHLQPLAHLIASYLPEKTIIFSYHTDTLDFIKERVLDEHKIPSILVNGKISQKKRDPLIHQFKTDNDMRVALLGITALGAGINLQEAQSVIFAEMVWTPEIQLQAEARCHRLTTVDPVHAFYPCVSKTLDDMMFDNLVRRQVNALSLLDYDPNYPDEAVEEAFRCHTTYRFA